jgi:hypothetical protein
MHKYPTPVERQVPPFWHGSELQHVGINLGSKLIFDASLLLMSLLTIETERRRRRRRRREEKMLFEMLSIFFLQN